MNRKILSVLLICMMLFSMVPSIVLAADGELLLTATMENDTVVKVGDTVTINISFDENPGVWGFDFSCNYDADVLTYVANAPVEESGFNFEVVNTAGEVSIVGYNKENKDSFYADDILSLEFTVNEDAMGVDSSIIELKVADEGDICNWGEDSIPVRLSAPIKFTVEAPVVEPETHTVTVVDGTVNGDITAEVEAGETVTVKANPAEDGFHFASWTGDVEWTTATTEKVASFTMPASDVTVTANYEEDVVAPTEYTVTVSGGTANPAKAKKGETVTVTANAAPTDKVFDKWTGTDVTFADANKATTTFTMPASNVTVTATYKDKTPVATQYDVDVTYGDAYVEGVAVTKVAAGNKVTIKADSRSGYTFDEWEVVKGKVAFADEDSATTSFTMPAEAVEVKATYTKNSSGGGSSSGGSGGGGGVVIGGGSTDKDENEVITNRLILNIDNPVATYNNNEIKNDVAPIIVDGRTYTPARFVAENWVQQ